MAMINTHRVLIFTDLITDNTATTIKIKKGIKAGYKAKESNHSPRNKQTAERCAPQPGHSTPK